MSANNNTTSIGKLGEELARQWLIDHGYVILHQNWRYSHYEVDIIAWKNDTLHFVEVKLRESTKYGMPEDSVTKTKHRHLMNAANQFTILNPQYRYLQIDILAINKNEKKEWEFFLIEDVF